MLSAAFQRVDRLYVNAVWLLRLRWVAAAGQLATIGVVHGIADISLPLGPLLTIIGITIVTNIGLHLWLTRFEHSAQHSNIRAAYWMLGCLMTIDLVSLTGLLYLTGGTANPFIVFYLVNLSLAAVLLRSAWCSALTSMAIVCCVVLFGFHRPLAALSEPAVVLGSPASATYGQVGMPLAVTLCSVVIVYFVTRISSELRRMDRDLRRADALNAKSQRLEALATLAAGAGHELASPLSSIAVIAGELTNQLQEVDVPSSVRHDVSLIRDELDHCRRILDRLSSHAGQAVGEALVDISVGDFARDAIRELRQSDRVVLELDRDVVDVQMHVPSEALAQSVRAVAQNGMDASSGDQPVRITVCCDGSDVVFEITDKGEGMSDDVLSHADEPFFTTKDVGAGMGLGLFLARRVVERVGGDLQITSQSGVGTTASLRWPIKIG